MRPVPQFSLGNVPTMLTHKTSSLEMPQAAPEMIHGSQSYVSNVVSSKGERAESVAIGGASAHMVQCQLRGKPEDVSIAKPASISGHSQRIVRSPCPVTTTLSVDVHVESQTPRRIRKHEEAISTEPSPEGPTGNASFRGAHGKRRKALSREDYVEDEDGLSDASFDDTENADESIYVYDSTDSQTTISESQDERNRADANNSHLRFYRKGNGQTSEVPPATKKVIKETPPTSFDEKQGQYRDVTERDLEAIFGFHEETPSKTSFEDFSRPEHIRTEIMDPLPSFPSPKYLNKGKSTESKKSATLSKITTSPVTKESKSAIGFNPKQVEPYSPYNVGPFKSVVGKGFDPRVNLKLPNVGLSRNYSDDIESNDTDSGEVESQSYPGRKSQARSKSVPSSSMEASKQAPHNARIHSSSTNHSDVPNVHNIDKTPIRTTQSPVTKFKEATISRTDSPASNEGADLRKQSANVATISTTNITNAKRKETVSSKTNDVTQRPTSDVAASPASRKKFNVKGKGSAGEAEVDNQQKETDVASMHRDNNNASGRAAAISSRAPSVDSARRTVSFEMNAHRDEDSMRTSPNSAEHTDLSGQYEERVVRSQATQWFGPHVKTIEQQQSIMKSWHQPRYTNTSIDAKGPENTSTKEQKSHNTAKKKGQSSHFAQFRQESRREQTKQQLFTGPVATSVPQRIRNKETNLANVTAPARIDPLPFFTSTTASAATVTTTMSNTSAPNNQVKSKPTAAPPLPEYICQGCVLDPIVREPPIEPFKARSEDEVYQHFLKAHCIAGVSVFENDVVFKMNCYDVCPACHMVFKKGLMHQASRCRKPRVRQNIRGAPAAENPIEMFRKTFATYNLSNLEPNVQVLRSEEIFQYGPATLNFMPGNDELQSQFRLIFIVVVRQITDANKKQRNEEPLWRFLMSLPRLILSIPHSRTNDRVSTATIVMNRISKVLNGEFNVVVDQYRELAAATKAASDGYRNRPVNPDTLGQQAVNIIRSSGDISRASKRLFSSMRVADSNEARVQELLSDLLRNEEDLQPRLADTRNHSCPTLSVDAIANAIKAMGKSGVGITGWHISHIKSIVSTQDGLESLALILNRIYSGRIPDAIRRGIKLSQLTPLSKENGGIRPVLVGDVLIRIIGKAVVVLEQNRIARRFEPLQLAVCARAGSEVVIHGVRAYLDAHPDDIAIGVDIKNAFGSVERRAVAEGLESYEYDDVMYTIWFYNEFGAPSSAALMSNGMILDYNVGLPQGGSLSMLWYCLAAHPHLSKANQLIPANEGIIISFADDTFIVAKPDLAFRVFDALTESSREDGLLVQPWKCQVLCPAEANDEQVLESMRARNFQQGIRRGIMILGTPVGTPAEEFDMSQELVFNDIFSRLRFIMDLQCRTILLRYCVVTKFQHLARTLPPSVSQHCLLHLDTETRAILCEMLDIAAISDEEFLRASLPLCYGGLGLKQLAPHRKLDYYASVSYALLHWRNVLGYDHPLIQSIVNGNSRTGHELDDALAACKALKNDFSNGHILPSAGDPAAPEEKLRPVVRVALPADVLTLFSGTTKPQEKVQSSLTQMNARVQFRILWKSMDVNDNRRIQFLANTTGTPAIVFQIIPTENSLVLENEVMAIILRQYLGLDIRSALGLPTDNDMPCCCNSSITLVGPSVRYFSGNHMYNCNSQRSYVERHTKIQNLLIACFRSVSIFPEVERVVSSANRQGAQGNHLSLQRFDLVGSTGDHSAKVVCIDIKVASHTSISHCNKARNVPGFNMTHAIREKNTKYFHVVNRSTEIFLAFVCESSGMIDQDAIRFISKLGRRVNGCPPLQASWAVTNFTQYWVHQLSAVLWRETALSLIRIAQRVLRMDRIQPVQADGNAEEEGDVAEENDDEDDDASLNVIV